MWQQTDSHQCYQLMLHTGTQAAFFSFFLPPRPPLPSFSMHAVLSFVLAEIRCINYEWLTKYTPVPEAAHQSFSTSTGN